MTNHVDAGNVGIYGSAIGGVATSTATWADAVNANAMAIGLGLTAVSLVVGIVFKALQVRQKVRHHREELDAQRKASAEQTEALRAELAKLREAPLPTP